MLTKEQVLESIKNMPEDRFDDIDVLLERIVILEKIARGEKDIEEGNVVSHEEVGKIIQTWFKK
jgi:hypothetical protein